MSENIRHYATGCPNCRRKGYPCEYREWRSTRDHGQTWQCSCGWLHWQLFKRDRGGKSD